MKRVAILAICLFAATGAFAQKKGAAAAPKGPGPKSKQELEAVNAMIGAQTPDARIQAADNLVTKFPSSDFKAFALYSEADNYQQKGDYAKAIVFGEQTLEADPKNYDADILLANVLAATTKDGDLDMNDKLTRADKYAHDALELLKTAEKSLLFNMTDEVWAKTKNEATSQAWQALGVSALVRKKNDEAVADFQKGLEANPDPLLMIRTARAQMAGRKYDDAIAWLDKAMAAPNASAQVKTIATSDKARAVAAKGGK